MISLSIFILINIFISGVISHIDASDLTVKNEHADRIVIEKAARKMMLYRGQNVIRTYRIALGGQPIGEKRCQGDERTPEGEYKIDRRNKNSHYHLSLHISYPNQADRKRAKELGCNPGGDIMIHGITNGLGWLGAVHTTLDWTLGCIAVTDEEIWELVPNGTRVSIKP
jgi:murein L,D-transpeptidase YafK